MTCLGTHRATRLEAADRADVFVPRAFAEQTVGLGEIRMNHATSANPALLLVPAQTEPWWGHEEAMRLLAVPDAALP